MCVCLCVCVCACTRACMFVCTFLQVPSQLVAGGARTEAALRAYPVDIEDGRVTNITHLPQPLHCTLPHWSHWRREGREKCCFIHIHTCIHSSTQSPTHSHTHSLTHPLTHTPTHSHPCSLPALSPSHTHPLPLAEWPPRLKPRSEIAAPLCEGCEVLSQHRCSCTLP